MPETAPGPTPSATDLPPTYTPAEVEGALYQRWEAKGYFTPTGTGPAEPYCIVIPPPNVTGSLHIGHAFQHTLMDALTRRRRMQGFDALWLPGMDHAGIATQTVVERQLAETEGKSKHDYSREAFVERVWAWKAEYGGKILGQMRRLGDGVDWTRERFTMDDGLSRAVQTIFKRLHDDGLIYRAERIINWCPRCQTALSDIEVEHSEDEGELVSIRYGDGENTLVVATTRAETMLGDTAVAVHPDDERYRHLVGTTLALPLTGRRIPVVADEHVDPEFGTGAVKVTPAHDPNDFEIGHRHGLASITMLDERAVVTVPGPFEGMDRFEARPAVVAALREEGRIVAEKRPYLHAVGHCQRCNTVVEPRLSMQWFVKVEPLARAAGDAVRDGRVAIHPKTMEPRYFDWVDNMHDWCISRQLWWGHRIPVYYPPAGTIAEPVCLGPDEEPPAGWVQDPDVLDTWFSSALWPFSTLGWPDDTEDLRRYYPTDVLLTGYDIIFFWVARMMMFGLYAMDGVQPFRTVALTGLVRDQHGRKMSKSRGNTVDPLEWIDAYGADALRFTLARGANPGTDVPIGEEWVAGSRNFATKLWNATRFALLNGAAVNGPMPDGEEQSVVDRWILSRLAAVTAQVDAGYEDFQFAKLSDALFHFVWDEVCDWYLELSKLPLKSEGPQAERTRRVLGEVLDVVLRLLHPVTPFVTEALWTELTRGSDRPDTTDSLMVAAWPEPATERLDPAAETEVAALQALVTEVRRFRADQGLAPGRRVPARLTGLRASLATHEAEVRALAGLDQPGEDFTASSTLTAGSVQVALDLRGAIDVPAERRRLERDLTAARRDLEASRAKLANEQFLAKAPEHVVAAIRDRADRGAADVARIEMSLAGLPTG